MKLSSCVNWVFFKLLPLIWDLEQVCVHPLKFKWSLDLQLLSGSPGGKPYWFPKPGAVVAHLPSVGSLGFELWFFREGLYGCDLSPAWESLFSGRGPWLDCVHLCPS